MSQITWADKVTLDAQPDIARINKVIDDDMNEIKSAHNDTDTKVSNIGKVLWEGSFSSGTITVPHLNEFIVIGVYVGALIMFGNQRYGGNSFTKYRSNEISHYGYRYTWDSTNNTLTIDSDNTGASDGTNYMAATKIIGLF